MALSVHAHLAAIRDSAPLPLDPSQTAGCTDIASWPWFAYLPQPGWRTSIISNAPQYNSAVAVPSDSASLPRSESSSASPQLTPEKTESTESASPPATSSSSTSTWMPAQGSVEAQVVWAGNVPRRSRGVDLRKLFDSALRAMKLEPPEEGRAPPKTSHVRVKRQKDREWDSAIIFLNQPVALSVIKAGLDLVCPGNRFLLRKCRSNGDEVSSRTRRRRRQKQFKKLRLEMQASAEWYFSTLHELPAELEAFPEAAHETFIEFAELYSFDMGFDKAFATAYAALASAKAKKTTDEQPETE